MKTLRRVGTACGLLAVALLLTSVAPALAADPGIVAEIDISPSKIVFYPAINDYERIILTVTGPCEYEYRKLLKRGEPGVFRLDSTTIDGVYSFELVAMPIVDDEIREVLQQARKYNDNSQVNQLCREGRMPGAPATQANSFVIANGEIIWDPDKQEPTRATAGASAEGTSDGLIQNASAGLIQNATLADFVINDDLIVDGSACIGFDCVNGEVFSFDTIRLKENNLRIKFDDTSVVPGFPATDWQLTANASANGGASKFSIEDISGSRTPFTVEANARSHSLYVDDGGRIGSRTSTPSTEIHTIDGDTPTLRLQQDGSSGFAPQTWDVAGNETNFFIRDVTNGSTLPFRIRPSAPTSSIFIDVDGDVGMGTASPDANLHVIETAAGVADLLELTANGNPRMVWRDTAAGLFWRLSSEASATEFVITRSGTGLREFVIDENGNVEARGTITASVASPKTLPDYVFEEDYPLMPLSEVESYIKEHKRLPKLPSAQTVYEEGLNMTDMQISLLEKVEELTLYTLEQQKVIEELRQENQLLAELQSRLEALEKAKD